MGSSISSTPSCNVALREAGEFSSLYHDSANHSNTKHGPDPPSPKDSSDDLLQNVLLEVSAEYWQLRADEARANVLHEKQNLVNLQHAMCQAETKHREIEERDIALKDGAAVIYESMKEVDAAVDVVSPQYDSDDNICDVFMDDVVPPAAPATPPADFLMEDIPAYHYCSSMAVSAVRPNTLPRGGPFPLDVPAVIAEAFPANPSIGLTQGDLEMGLALDSFNVLEVLGGVVVVRRLANEVLKRLLISGCACPGGGGLKGGVPKKVSARVSGRFGGWLCARLGSDDESELHVLTSMAQLAMVHSVQKITPEAADLWLECMLEAMHVALPSIKSSAAVACAHAALHQFFHFITRSLVNDF